MKRDHTELLCNIGELSGLFTDATSLETFLQSIVEMTSEHMHSEVCSIYLYNEDKQELVLKATKGLRPEAIGQVRLKLGEGLTGLAVKELRPICVQQASRTHGYRYFPELGEERYESFMAVPILRGQTRIGAMVIQNSRKNYFTDADINAFRAVTSQLAMTIETAKLLMDLDERQDVPVQSAGEPKELRFIQGRVGAAGFAMGFPRIISEGAGLAAWSRAAEDKNLTIADFHQAVAGTALQLETLQQEIEEKLSDVASLIFTAQILMLKDHAFIEQVEAMVEGGVPVVAAVTATIEKYVKKFEALENDYLREKRHDVQDIGRRLLRHLAGDQDEPELYQDQIVIARELFPSDMLKLSTQKVAGIILLSGGITSHLSILARSLKIPLVISDEPALLRIGTDRPILLDAEQGNIHIDPDDDVITSFRKQEDVRRQVEERRAVMKPSTYTADGQRVTLLANINLLSDLAAARAALAEGIGLYRTEFPFIVRSDFPSEEEQFVIYRKLVEGMKGEVTFRTLDIGGDKVLSYYTYGREENPFLGMRSIRFSLRHKDIFRQQLRAILRAGAGCDLRIMFPMISSVDELIEAKEQVQISIKELQERGVACHDRPQIGMMAELPAVLPIMDELAAEVEFFSIGTNDFIQYMLAVDRTNEKVADLYLPHHPAILRALQQIVDSARRYRRDVSVCGDMAQDTRYLPYFLGIGVRKFSTDPHFIPDLQQFIMSTSAAEAQQRTQNLLKQTRLDVIKTELG